MTNRSKYNTNGRRAKNNHSLTAKQPHSSQTNSTAGRQWRPHLLQSNNGGRPSSSEEKQIKFFKKMGRGRRVRRVRSTKEMPARPIESILAFLNESLFLKSFFFINRLFWCCSLRNGIKYMVIQIHIIMFYHVNILYLINNL